MAGNFPRNCLSNLFTASVFIAGCSILLLAAFPIAQITIGAVYMYECPAAPTIPVYVMVCGILALQITGLFAFPKLCPATTCNKIWTVWTISLILFVFAWFIYGSYQIYSIYPPNYTKTTTDPISHNNSLYSPTAADNNHTLRNISSETNRDHLSTPAAGRVTAAVAYCDKTVYLFAFWTTTLVYVFAGNALVIIICLYGCMKATDILTSYFTT